MSENYNDPFFSHDQKNVDTVTPSEKTKFIIPVVLFIVTFFTTTLAGAEWIRGFGTRFEFSELIVGLPYSISILFVLATHEFG
ncbi:MAG: site-2 protease family protein, partial [Ignavibacteriaceae bacterium]|nr:site-2 protease family protein [Ignavibacteriaceae bacterium]